MPKQLVAGLPPDLDIGDGYVLRFAAISATDGSAVAGVVVSEVSIFAAQLAGPGGDTVPLPALVPSEQLV